MAGKDKVPFPVFGGKDDGNDPVSRTERKGRDLSDFFAQMIFKHDMIKTSEKKSTSYPLYNSAGQVIGTMDPANGFTPMGGGSPSPGVSLPFPTVRKSSKGKDRSANAFCSIGAQQEEDKEKDEKEQKIKQFLETITENEYKALEALAKDRLLLDEGQIRKTHKKGRETGFERLIDLDFARWDKFDGTIEIRITPTGRRLYASLA